MDDRQRESYHARAEQQKEKTTEAKDHSSGVLSGPRSPVVVVRDVRKLH